MTAKRTHNRNSGPLFPKALILIFVALVLVGIGIWIFTRTNSNAANTKVSETNTESVRPAEESLQAGSDSESNSQPFPLSVSLPDHVPSAIVCYEGFTVSFNRDNHTPNYSAWDLVSDETDGPVKRSNKFYTDNNVDGCPDTHDYSNSGYDRGHMCPANDQKWSEKAMTDCFYMTNMCPQDHDLNNGAWKTLETKTQQWAKRDGLLYIIAGPIYTENDKKRIGSTGVRVPSAFFKVIVSPTVEKPRGIAFVYPNMRASGNMRDYSCTIDQLEGLTGYNFFPEMSPELEREIEAVTSFKEWNRNK